MHVIDKSLQKLYDETCFQRLRPISNLADYAPPKVGDNFYTSQDDKSRKLMLELFPTIKLRCNKSCINHYHHLVHSIYCKELITHK